MAFESVRSYVQLASGLGEMTGPRRWTRPQGLLSLPGADEVDQSAPVQALDARRRAPRGGAGEPRQPARPGAAARCEAALATADVARVADVEAARGRARRRSARSSPTLRSLLVPPGCRRGAPAGLPRRESVGPRRPSRSRPAPTRPQPRRRPPRRPGGRRARAEAPGAKAAGEEGCAGQEGDHGEEGCAREEGDDEAAAQEGHPRRRPPRRRLRRRRRPRRRRAAKKATAKKATADEGHGEEGHRRQQSRPRTNADAATEGRRPTKPADGDGRPRRASTGRGGRARLAAREPAPTGPSRSAPGLGDQRDRRHRHRRRPAGPRRGARPTTSTRRSRPASAVHRTLQARLSDLGGDERSPPTLDAELVRRGLARSRGAGPRPRRAPATSPSTAGRPPSPRTPVGAGRHLDGRRGRAAVGGRAAYKLVAALETFGPHGPRRSTGRRCLDVGRVDRRLHPGAARTAGPRTSSRSTSATASSCREVADDPRVDERRGTTVRGPAPPTTSGDRSTSSSPTSASSRSPSSWRPFRGAPRRRRRRGGARQAAVRGGPRAGSARAASSRGPGRPAWARHRGPRGGRGGRPALHGPARQPDRAAARATPSTCCGPASRAVGHDGAGRAGA